MEVKGRVALVTGANRGLGRALVEALKQAGAAKVYAAARNPESITADGVTAIRLDVTDRAAARAAAERCGDVDILINNAGITRPGPIFSDEFADTARALLDTNFFGILNVSGAFAPVLGRNGGGAIVNILSVLTWLAFEGTVAYCASKSAAWALTNGMRAELKKQGTFVSGVHVGYMDTDMIAGLSVPKAPPEQIARRIIEGLAKREPEILADDVSVQVKSALSAKEAPYLTT
jgi:NAD(P)-dependent dehydrogenase (short-subunit alcohol dehydrogenase family)